MRRSCRIFEHQVAAFSATIRTGALVLPEVTAGKTEASTTRRPARPCTLSARIDDGEPRVRSHAAGADRVEHASTRAARMSSTRSSSRLHVRPGLQLLVDHGGQRRRGRQPAQEARAVQQLLEILRRVASEFGTITGGAIGSADRTCR